jgi:hypothetical protein
MEDGGSNIEAQELQLPRIVDPTVQTLIPNFQFPISNFQFPALYPPSPIVHPRSSILDPPSSILYLQSSTPLARSAEPHSHSGAEVESIGREPKYLLIVLIKEVFDSRKESNKPPSVI